MSKGKSLKEKRRKKGASPHKKKPLAPTKVKKKKKVRGGTPWGGGGGGGPGTKKKNVRITNGGEKERDIRYLEPIETTVRKAISKRIISEEIYFLESSERRIRIKRRGKVKKGGFS